MVFFSIFWCCTQIGDQSHKDLAKFGYKTNIKVKKSGIWLYIGDLQETTI
jgi:hypothetical protein